MTSETESTMDELATAAAEHAAATKRVNETRDVRDAAIRAAAAAGGSPSAIARTAGVSREIVYRVIGSVVAVVLAILTLGACGSDEPATSPAVDRTPVAVTTAPQTPSEAVSEAECYSAEDTKALDDMWIALPHSDAPVAVRIAALEKMLAAIPADSELCDDSDLIDVQSYRESALMNLAELRAGS